MKTDFFNQYGKQFFFNDAFAIAEYAHTHYPADCRCTIEAANDVAAHKFLFNLRWDMERTTDPVIFDSDIDWLYQPGEDPEWVFAFNRMRFWICLGQAYALTRDEKYARCFAKQLSHWVKTVRQDDPKSANAWRSIEVGLRLEYWLKSIHYFRDSPVVDDSIVEIFCKSVAEQAEFLMKTWNTFNLISNWGVLSNQGLFAAGVTLPKTGRTAQYVNTASERLSHEIEMQVYRDGTHWEQSPMYHNEVMNCYLNVLTLANRNKINLSENIERKTRDMCYASVYAAKPDHCEISMGDSDNVDQRDLLTRAAALFKDGFLKARAYEKPDYDSIWDIGEKGIREYETIAPVQPADTDKAFSDSGNFYFRSNWESDATFLHFHNGTLGAGHGHADKLHIDLFSMGEDILVDAGRYTYAFESGRVEFKELRAHNTVMVDDKDIYVCKDSWKCSKLTRGINRHFYSDARYGYAEGGHLGYIDCGVYVNRRVIYLRPDIVVVCDEFYTKDQHNYNQFFHFNNKGSLEGENNRFLYKGDKAKAQIILMASGINSEISDSKISRHYNLWERNKMITTSFSKRGFTSAYMVLALSDIRCMELLEVQKAAVYSNFRGVEFSDSQIEALSISYGQKKYTLVIAHEEYACPTDAFIADGCVGFGNCVIFDKSAGENETGVVLLW